MDCESFLSGMGFMPSDAALVEGREAFRRAMVLGLAGQPGGLPMLPSYLPLNHHRPTGEALVLDAGGTNLRTAHVRLTVDGMEILARKDRPMPGTKGRLSREAFFRSLAEDAAAMMTSPLPIGFCFSFTADILPDGDARVLYLDKELQVDGLVGETVAAGLRKALHDLGAPDPSLIRVMNDAPAALLGAVTQHPGAEGCIGMILGTGFNCCYGEENRRMTKAPALLAQEGRSIVNIESGAFSHMTPSPADLLVRKGSIDPDQSVLEKMLSGAYQGPLLGGLLELAAAQGMLVNPEILTRVQPTAIDVSKMVNGQSCPLEESFPDARDKALLRELSMAIVRRAVLLVSMTLHGILDEMGAKEQPVLLAVEGSTYWKNPLLQQLLAEALADCPVQFVRTEEANLMGAAAAVVGCDR